MKKIIMFAVAVLTLLPVAAFAGGGGLSTGSGAQSSTATVTVIIPAQLGIDIESDVTFDFATYTTGTNCVANQWPPQFCGAGTKTRYDGATANNTGSGGAPQTSAIWMAVFSSDNTAANKITAAVDAAWDIGTPGFATTDITSEAALLPNNPMNIGPATATNFTTAGSVVTTTATNTFPWTRADQVIKLLVPNSTSFNDGTYHAKVTYTISK